MVPIPLSDVYALLGVAVGLGALVALGAMLYRHGGARRSARHVVHAGVGVFVAFTPDLFSKPTAVYGLAAAFAFVNGWTLRRGWLPGMHASAERSWGTVLFPLALIPALYFCWTLQPDRQFALRVAFLILAFADPVAAWAGRRFGHTILLDRNGGQTSGAGSAAFGTVAFLTSMTALVLMRHTGAIDWTLLETAVAAGSVAMLTTVAEALGRRGWDNLFIVMAAICTLVVFDEVPAARSGIPMALAVGLAFGVGAWRAGALDRSGAVAAGLFAVTLIAGGWRWAVPGVVFFVLSSSLSWVGRRRKRVIQQHYEKSKTARDAAQVSANGGVAWGLLIVYLMAPWDGLYWGFVGAFAAAAADTWATELGAFSFCRPRSLRTGERVPRGTSGAISGVGSLAALAGAATVVGSAAGAGGFEARGLWAVGLLVGCGWIGAFADSLAGALLQAQYYDVATGSWREYEGAADDRPARGWRGVTNDHVNWIGTCSGALAALVAYITFG